MCNFAFGSSEGVRMVFCLDICDGIWTNMMTKGIYRNLDGIHVDFDMDMGGLVSPYETICIVSVKVMQTQASRYV
jgi:hypothetical protein